MNCSRPKTKKGQITTFWRSSKDIREEKLHSLFYLEVGLSVPPPLFRRRVNFKEGDSKVVVTI